MNEIFKTGEDLELPAGFLNDLVRMLNEWRRGLFRSQQWPSTPPNYDTIKIKNTTGGTLARFAIVGIGDSVYDPAESDDQYKAQTIFEGVEPAYPDYFSKWAVLLQAIPNSGTGTALRVGRIVVNLQVRAAHHKYVDISDTGIPDDLFRPVSNDVGFARILHKGGDSGDQLATIVVGDQCWDRNFQLGAALSPGAFASAFIRELIDDEWTVTERTVDVFDGISKYTGIGPDFSHDGEKGWARWNPSSLRFEIQSLQDDRDAI